MPGSKTAYLSQKVLDHCHGVATYTPPANVWLVLSTAAFSSTATRATISEITGGSYAPLEVTNDGSTWAAASAAAPSSSSNLNDLTWPAATADWGTPLSVYVADAASGGNLLYGADLNNSADVASGDTFKVLAGTFVFTED